MVRLPLLLAGLNGALGVAMGAWAAHGLQASLAPDLIEWVRTGASYQLWHAAALVGVAAAGASYRTRLLIVAGLGLGIGALVFAGALYLYALAGLAWASALAPFGGLLMIGGWLAVIAAAIRWRPAR